MTSGSPSKTSPSMLGLPGPALPVDAALPALLDALAAGPRAVLEAPPGAGKTTRVPLALLGAGAPWRGDGAVIMLEPRRIAARAAAERLAASVGERVGGRVGYRIRDESAAGPATRLEVVTEAILTRKLQADPALSGVAAVIFDEFHERSLHADLALALALDAQGALRPDLRLIVMSATLDGAAVAALLGGEGPPAPVVRAEGRMHPVETVWRERPVAAPISGPPQKGAPRFEDDMAAEICAALAAGPGDALAFLPGAAEIRRTAAALDRRADAALRSVDVIPLYGALSSAEQRRALAPAPEGRRKLVLATAIAETSLTIDGVRIVIDGGRSRAPRFDPRSGMSRLETRRVSRAGAEQRRGRAGRTAPGRCHRLWTKGEEGGFAPFDRPEILEADLAALALELAEWGAAPEALGFLDPPPAAPLAQARALLTALGALEPSGRLTEHGRRLARAPLHPRLAHMVLCAPPSARETALRLAVLLEARDPLRGAAGADVQARLAAVQRGETPETRALREEAKRLGRRVKSADGAQVADAQVSDAQVSDAQVADAVGPGALLALAYPDRIARRRPGQQPRYVLSGGKGGVLPEGDALAGAPWLVAADLDGDAREARIRLAAPLSEAVVLVLFGGRVVEEAVCDWSRRERRVIAVRRRRLGAAPISEEPWRDPPEGAVAAALVEGVRRLGLEALPWRPADQRLLARARFAAASKDPQAAALPDLSDAGLRAALEAWLAPHLGSRTRAAELADLDLSGALWAWFEAALAGRARSVLDRLAPPRFETPAGSSAPIDYSGDAPRAAVRLQALFGLDAHPMVAGRPLLLDLLSPAERPIQTTADLPGFWRGSYADAAKDMRARYPKHPWPDDPAAAAPTLRAKPRR